MDEFSEFEPIAVVVIDEDETSARSFASELSYYGFPSQWFGPTDLGGDLENTIVFCPERLKPPNATTWIAVDDDTSLEARLSAVRCGAMGFLNKPVSVHHAVDLIQEIATRPSSIAPGKVLVIEDEEDVLNMVLSVLEEAEIESMGFSDPELLLQSVSEFQPDVIVMDFYLENITGLELATVFRHWEQARPVPIVFLTGETRAEIEHEVLSTGIDHFMTKPIENQKFLAVIQGLIQRSRKLHNIADVDPLTRLHNRRFFHDRLEQEIERSRREFRPLAYVMIDLDNFKQVNDTHGHLVGDEVLRQFALLMRNQMRQSDILGRVGGEEFAIVLPGATPSQCEIAMERLRETTDQVLFGQEQEIELTFSYGVAMWNEASTAKSLYARADGELYRAKRAGKNRGFISESEDDFADT